MTTKNFAEELTKEIAADTEIGGYAWAWLCNIAVPIADKLQRSYANISNGEAWEFSNRTAVTLMKNLFDIDMSAQVEGMIAVRKKEDKK